MIAPRQAQQCGILLICLLVFFSASAGAKEVITFGVQPYIPPLYLEKNYGPLIKALSKQLDKPVNFRTRRNLDEYHDAIGKEEFEIILVNPFDYVYLREDSNYLGLLQRSGEIKTSFFVVNKNINSLEKLRGLTIGFPPLGMANTILGLEMLYEAGIQPDQYRRTVFNEHLSCKQALSSGHIDACVSSPLFVQNRLRNYDVEYVSIATSRGIPSSVIMIHRRIQHLEEPLRVFFLSLNTTAAGRKLLSDALLGELGELVDNNYEVVRQIGEDRKTEGW